LRSRLIQSLIIVIGLLGAGVMVLLGIWQLDVYQSQGVAVARARAAEQPVPLLRAAPAGSPVPDGYGRSVTFSGRYVPELQLLVPVASRPGVYRVLSGLRQRDGSVVPVIRGEVDGTTAPPPPGGVVDHSGVLLPSEPEQPGRFPSGQIGSVRVAALAQTWPGPLVAGYVTLSAADAAEEGLAAAPVTLPEEGGRLRNAAYALQWWVFAVFALAMAARMARDYGVHQAAAEGTEVSEITDVPESRAT
jgi:cytochrome oxidase assembly protein ShyY1